MTTSIACTYPNVINTVANSFKALSGNTALTPERFIECLKVIINADLHTVLGDAASIVVNVKAANNDAYVTHVVASDGVDVVNVAINHTRLLNEAPRKVFTFVPEPRQHMINQIYDVITGSFKGMYDLNDVGDEFVDSIQRHIRIHIGLLTKTADQVEVGITRAGSDYVVKVKAIYAEEPIEVSVHLNRQAKVY